MDRHRIEVIQAVGTVGSGKIGQMRDDHKKICHASEAKSAGRLLLKKRGI